MDAKLERALAAVHRGEPISEKAWETLQVAADARGRGGWAALGITREAAYQSYAKGPRTVPKTTWAVLLGSVASIGLLVWAVVQQNAAFVLETASVESATAEIQSAFECSLRQVEPDLHLLELALKEQRDAEFDEGRSMNFWAKTVDAVFGTGEQVRLAKAARLKKANQMVTRIEKRMSELTP